MSTLSRRLIMAGGSEEGVAGGVEPVGIDFDGTNDYLIRTTDLVGNTDSKTFTFSFWGYVANGAFLQTIRFRDLGVNINIANAGTELSFDMRNSGGSLVTWGKAYGFNVNNTWAHFLISFDMTSTANRYIYLNDEQATITFNSYSNAAIGFTRTPKGIGANPENTNQIAKGRLAHVYLDYTYRDLSIEANRRLFIDEDGRPATGQAALNPILYLPMDDPDDPGRNDGTGGDFTLNGTIARSGRGPNQYNAAASTFDGANDYLSRSSFIPRADRFTISFCVKKDPISGNKKIFHIGGGQFQVGTTSSNNHISILCYSLGSIFRGNLSINDVVPVGAIRHVSVSWVLGAAPVVYVDGKLHTNITVSTNNNGDIQFDQTTRVCVDDSGTQKFAGLLGDLYFDTTYIDLSANNPFWDAETGKPKYLGQNGELPTGTAPLIYLPLRADDAGANKGTGGDFTVNSGPFVGARGPSEFWADSAKFNGTNQYLEKNSAIGTDGRFFTLALAIKPTARDAGQVFTADSSNVFSLNANSGTFSLGLGTSSGTRIFYTSSFGTHASGSGAWNTLLMCVNMDNVGDFAAYVDGINVTPTPSTFVGGNDIGFSYATGFEIAAQTGVNNFKGSIGFLWLSNEYIDFSQESNRLKFFDAFGYPVDLGGDGSLPTGNQPLIYMNEGFHLGTNLGSGGDFTPVNGPTDGGSVKG